jgi:hypothetical protein
LDTDLRGLPPFAKDSGASSSVPSVPAGKSGDKASWPPRWNRRRGIGVQGNLEEPPSTAALGSGLWQSRQRTTRMCSPCVSANAAPPHSRERECGCVIPEDARSQDGKNWHVLVTFSTTRGAVQSPRPLMATVCETNAWVIRVTPRRPLSGRGKRAQGRLGSQTLAVRSATLPNRARSPTQNREGHESHRVGNAAVGR